MLDAPATNTETNKMNSEKDSSPEQDRQPFGGLEFQVSEVVGRLEAVANAQEPAEEEKRPDLRKISAGFFEPEEMSMDDILKDLEELVKKTDPNCDALEPSLLPTDAVTRAAILSHSISALFSKLERSHSSRLGAHIASETTRWMSHMFRLTDYSAFYHQEQLEGLVRVTRMLLHHRYPRYLEDGALAFANRLPCIYSCVASPLGVVQHLCRQLGLPLACVRPVPVPADAGRGMDIEALDRLMEEDMASDRIPLLALGEAGAPPLGNGSHVGGLAAACARRNVHLHLSGHALALPAACGRDQTYSIADSLTLTPGLWFGVPGLPTVTFYKIPEPITANGPAKGTSTGGSSAREVALAATAGLGGRGLCALPLWASARAAGGGGLTRRVARAFRSAQLAYDVIAAAELRILSARPGGDEPPNMDIVDAISGASACVAFQFAPAGVARPPPYYDKLNSWLGQVLQREADMISIDVCETESYGVVLRYCPLEGAAPPPDAGALADALDAQLHVLRATVALRDEFQQHVARAPCLRLVHVPGWAGLGGVRYIPPGWEDAPAEELNSLNRQLVDTLRATDNAFSCGDGDDGLACVRFGMVTEDTDVEQLLDLVVTAGKEVEESSRVLTDMTEVLKKGIEEAEASLRSAADEGILRRVPVVGRVVSWWAPPAPAAGRRLLLKQGTLQPTTDVYRCVQKKDDEEPARAHSPTRQPQPDPEPAE